MHIKLIMQTDSKYSWQVEFTLTGVTSWDPKAVEPVDDHKAMMMCWLQYHQPFFFSNRTHVIVTDIPYILPIIPELFFNLLLPIISPRNTFLKSIWVYAGSLRPGAHWTGREHVTSHMHSIDGEIQTWRTYYKYSSFRIWIFYDETGNI